MELKHAGFWIRFLAFSVDGILFYPVYLLFTTIMAYILFKVYGLSLKELSQPQYAISMEIVSGIVFFPLFALFDSSSMQATPGKMLFSLKVVGLHGERISFAKASLRYFSRQFSGMLFMIGYIMIAFTHKKRGLHDIVCGTYVVYENKEQNQE